MTKHDNTGRDGLIICKALAYAIAAIEALPEEWQEWSDKEDVVNLLRFYTDNADYFMTGARSHLERRGIAVEDGEMVLGPKPNNIRLLKSGDDEGGER
jgi:hypothetical protein